MASTFLIVTCILDEYEARLMHLFSVEDLSSALLAPQWKSILFLYFIHFCSSRVQYHILILSWLETHFYNTAVRLNKMD